MNIPSFLIGYLAGKKPSGGGSSDDVCYVTFMSYDGLTEYGKKAVAVGDDCADPIARGIFDTPTRESTAQYNYTFYGWANIPNGGAYADWNKSITEDKTVYANFAAAVRYYTITYYDGNTVLKTEKLPYGTSLDYAPVKSGYKLIGWEPELAPVTADAVYYAQWKELSGFSHVLTMAEADLPTNANGLKYGKTAINNAGSLLAFAFGSRQNDGNSYPPVYNISDGTPVKLAGSAISFDQYSDLAFNYDGAELYVEGYKTSDLKHYIAKFATDNLSGFLGSTLNNSSGSSAPIVCSPVSDRYGWFRQVSGSNYNFLQKNGETDGATISVGFKADMGAYSPDGVHVAFAEDYSGGANVYTIDGALVADATQFNSKKNTKVSYNADGSLLAVSYNVAPWVEVYETTNYTKVCDLSDIVSATAYAEFLGSDILVVGSGTSVQVRTITETGHKAYEDNVPAYEEWMIVRIYSWITERPVVVQLRWRYFWCTYVMM